MDARQHAPSLVERSLPAWIQYRSMPLPVSQVINGRGREANSPLALLIAAGIEQPILVLLPEDKRVHAAGRVERSRTRRQNRIFFIALPGMDLKFLRPCNLTACGKRKNGRRGERHAT